MEVTMYITWLCLMIGHHGLSHGGLVVDTNYGSVEGQQVMTTAGRSVVSFLGIPYARPPQGHLRWKKPKDPEPWTGILQADTSGKACLQVRSIGMTTNDPDNTKYGEDCLYLNIFTPNDETKSIVYPVMVFLHGGNNQLIGYAQRGVITVVPNYRMGVLGFLSGGDEECLGNQGFLDQVKVLDYVQENIANFGGDPARVTIAGWGAGANSVNMHLVSPRSRGLFKQAMMFSGIDLDMEPADQDTCIERTKQTARYFSCPITNTKVMMDCLRGISAEDLMRNGTLKHAYQSGLYPCIDDKRGFLPDSPHYFRNTGQFSKVPLLVGKANKEMAFLLLPIGQNGEFSNINFRSYLKKLIRIMFSNLNAYTLEGIVDLVETNYGPVDGGHLVNRHRIVQIVEDLMVQNGIDNIIQLFARHNLTTFQYNLGYRCQALKNTFPAWIGVPQVFSLDYLMANGQQVNNGDYSQKDMFYINHWLDLLTNFIKYGNPTPEPLPAPKNNNSTFWKPYSLTDQNYLDIDDVIDTKKNRRQGYLTLWSEIIPQMVNNVVTSTLQTTTSSGFREPCTASETETQGCVNGGTCLAVQVGEERHLSCDCPPNWTGPRCQFFDIGYPNIGLLYRYLLTSYLSE